jgi:hypothetical protein
MNSSYDDRLSASKVVSEIINSVAVTPPFFSCKHCRQGATLQGPISAVAYDIEI